MSNLAELVSAQLAPIEERVRPQGGKIVRCVIPRVMRDFIQQDSAITLSGKDSLTYHELSATLPQLYDSSYVLEETLADLAGSPVDLEELRLTLYQGGNKAYIIFNEARLANSSDRYHFITYLSRGKVDTEHGREATADFHNLQFTAERFAEVYTRKTLQTVNVIHPIQMGVSAEGYPYFTMPFSREEGELSMTASELILPNDISRYFYNYQYALPYTEEMQRVNAEQQMFGPTALQMIAAELAMTGIQDPDFLLDLLLKTNIYSSLQNQHLQVLRANAHVYAATGMFPREHAVNAGDWTASIKDQCIPSLTLITIRGGYEEIDDEGWITRMQGHKERVSVYGKREKSVFQPFANISSGYIRTLLSDIRSIMKKEQEK